MKRYNIFKNGDSRRYDGDDSCTSTLDEFPDIDQHHPGRYVNPEAPITEAMQKQIDDYFLGLAMTEEAE